MGRSRYCLAILHHAPALWSSAITPAAPDASTLVLDLRESAAADDRCAGRARRGSAKQRGCDLAACPCGTPYYATGRAAMLVRINPPVPGPPRASLRLPGCCAAGKRVPPGQIPESEIPHCVRDDNGAVGMTRGASWPGGNRVDGWGGKGLVQAASRSRRSLTAFGMTTERSGDWPWVAGRWLGGGSAGKRLPQGKIPESEILHFVQDDNGEVGEPTRGERAAPGRRSARRRLPQGQIPELEIPHCVRDDNGEVRMIRGPVGRAVTGQMAGVERAWFRQHPGVGDAALRSG